MTLITARSFEPRMIANCALWLDGSDISTLGNTSTAAGGTSNNGPVKFWGDKSGNGRNAINAGADSVCPTRTDASQNGRTILGFDGGDSLTGDWALTLTAETVFAVFKYATTASNFGRVFTQIMALQIDDFVGTNHYIPMLRNGTGNSFGSYAGSAMRGTVNINTATWYVGQSRHSGSAINNRIGLNAYATASSLTLNTTFTSYRVGHGILNNTATAAHWADAIAEVVVYSRSLSDDEADRVVRYLARKWAITI